MSFGTYQGADASRPLAAMCVCFLSLKPDWSLACGDPQSRGVSCWCPKNHPTLAVPIPPDPGLFCIYVFLHARCLDALNMAFPPVYGMESFAEACMSVRVHVLVTEGAAYYVACHCSTSSSELS